MSHQIESLTSLELLEMERCGLTNESLAHLPLLKNLKHLRIGGNEITDAGLAYIPSSPSSKKPGSTAPNSLMRVSLNCWR